MFSFFSYDFAPVSRAETGVELDTLNTQFNPEKALAGIIKDDDNFTSGQYAALFNKYLGNIELLNSLAQERGLLSIENRKERNKALRDLLKEFLLKTAQINQLLYETRERDDIPVEEKDKRYIEKAKQKVRDYLNKIASSPVDADGWDSESEQEEVEHKTEKSQQLTF